MTIALIEPARGFHLLVAPWAAGVADVGRHPRSTADEHAPEDFGLERTMVNDVAVE